MAWLRRKTTSGIDVAARMPPAAEHGRTELFSREADARSRPGEHGSHIQHFDYLDLLHDRQDLPVYSGAGGRPAILLSVSPRLRANLDGLDQLIRRTGATLYLQGVCLTRYALLRAVLELPEYDLIFESPLTLADGEVQEFLVAAHHTEQIELHLTHATDCRQLRFCFQANRIRTVIDAALDATHDLEHPNHAALDAAANELESRYPKVSDGLTARTKVRLIAAGTPDGVVTMTANH